MSSTSDTFRRLTTLALLAAVLAIGTFDSLTGRVFSPSPLYLAPVIAGTVTAGRTAGIALAGASAASGLVADTVLGRGPNRAIAGVNSVLMLAILVVVVELFVRVRAHRDRAVAAEQRSREFLALAAHQVRSPLAGVRAGVDALVIEGADGPRAELILSGIAQDADRASRLISSMLRMARLDERPEVKSRPTDVNQVVEAQVERSKVRTARAIDLAITPGSTSGAWAECNPVELAEALDNLLDNAVRHADRRVDVSICEHNGSVEIVVADDGPGLPPGKEAQAFDRFVTLDGLGGTGLGLTIAQGICRAQGGSLTYRDKAFVVHLPRSDPR